MSNTAIHEIFLGLLVGICAVGLIAHRLRIPYPIAFVLAGIGVALMPGLPEVQLHPDLIFLFFLPPLLAEAAYFTSLRDFRENLGSILFLALGLVAVTSAVVAATFTLLIPAAGLAVGFVLGAIISPPDAVAAISITRRLRVPSDVTAILEGESLINDATALVIYKFALAAVITGTFSGTHAGMEFLWIAAAGTAIGLALGYLLMWIIPHLREASVAIIATFIAPYAAYLTAEAWNASGVLSVVACGLYVGWHAPERFTPALRIKALSVWETVTFLLNGIVFLLIGLQFPWLLGRLAEYSTLTLIGYAGAIVLVTILIRLMWVFAASYGSWFLIPRLRKQGAPAWQNVLIVGWTGMRGVVSLATALAIPFATKDGLFPYRDLIIFLAFCAIAATLIFQGLTLPWIIRKLKISYDFKRMYEDWEARKQAAAAALIRIEELSGHASLPESVIYRIRAHYKDRIATLGEGPSTPLYAWEETAHRTVDIMKAEQELWQETVEAERKILISLRKAKKIGDNVMRQIEHELDLMHARFHA